MKRLLAGMLFAGALAPAWAQGDLFQLTDDVNVTWQSPQEVIQGLGRKFYAGETLHVTVTGQFVENDTRTEQHCKVFSWFCEDVVVPTPQTFVPSTNHPLSIGLWSDTGNTPHPSVALQISVSTLGFDLIIPDDTADGFGKAWRIRAMIGQGTNLNRSICVGTYSIHINVDNTRRLAAFQNYLAAGARKTSEVRDVLDERLTTHYGPQVADALALHAQARFANNPNPALKAEYPQLLEFAFGLDSGSPSIPRKLSEYYISTGNFPQAQANALAQARNATDDADRGRAYLLLGQVKEGERTQFETGAVRAAAALYDQAAELGLSAQHRTLLLDALNRDALAQRRIRTTTTLGRAAELFERARDAAPAYPDGLVADVDIANKLLLTTKVRLGFALESNLTLTSGPFVGAAEDDWAPVASDMNGNILVARSGGDVQLWNQHQNAAQHLGFATVSEAAIGSGSALVLATNGDLILMSPSRPQRVVLKSALRTPGVPPAPNIPVMDFFGIATGAEVLYWSSPGSGVHIQSFQGDELRTIPVGANEFILQGALSGSGSIFAAVVATVPPPGQPFQSVLRIWNVQDASPFKVATNAQGANLSASRWTIRKGAVSFSPDGRRIYWNVDKLLHAIRLPEGTLESSLDVGAVLPQGPPEDPAAPVRPVSHVWVDTDHIAVYATLDPAPAPEKPVVLVKHSTFTAAPGLSRPSYTFQGLPGTYPFLGPFFLGGSKEGEVFAVRAVQKHQAVVYSLTDGTEHGRRDFEPPDNNNTLAIADEGHTIVEMDSGGTTLYSLSSSEVVRRNTTFARILEDLGHGDWQIAEFQLATGRVVALHRFHGRVETGAASLPPLDAAADIIGPGKLCAPPAGPSIAAADWTPFVSRVSQQGVRLVPNGFLFMPPGNYPHNMMDVPMISMSTNLPPTKEIRRLMSCAPLVALATGSKAALQIVVPGIGMPQRLVFAPGEGTANTIDVLSAIAPTAGPNPSPATVEARFQPDGQSFSVAVIRPNQAPQVSYWKYTGSDLAQQACKACSRPNLSSSEAVHAAYPNYAAPSVWFSMSGRKVLLVAGDRLLVHDFTTNSIQFQIDVESPIALTDEALVTVGKDKKLHVWKY